MRIHRPLSTISPTTPVGTVFRCKPTPFDVSKTHCGSPSHCLGAMTVDREGELGGKGYIDFRSNTVYFTKHGHRYGLHPSENALQVIALVDRLGEILGEVEAIKRLLLRPPRAFSLRLMTIKPAAPPRSRARKDQINAARNRAREAARAMGLPARQPRRRYTGIIIREQPQETQLRPIRNSKLIAKRSQLTKKPRAR